MVSGQWVGGQVVSGQWFGGSMVGWSVVGGFNKTRTNYKSSNEKL